MPGTPTKIRSYGAGEAPTTMPEGFRLSKREINTVVAQRMADGTRYTRSVATSYRMGIPTRLPPHATRGYGAAGVAPIIEVEMVDAIAPTLDSAVAARLMMTQYRAVADKILEDAWASAIAKEFSTGPSRWPALSHHYALWKMRQGKGGVANLILSGKIAQNVYQNAREAVKVSGTANPNYRIDVLKQFRTTPYVWQHEYGNPLKHLPQRDFINRARAEVTSTMGGIAATEFVVITETLKGTAVRTPRHMYVGPRGTVDKPGTFSFAWLGRWFAHPYWWVVPPSKALLYFGIASDVRTILTRGIQLERMVIPFVSAWGLGMAGAKVGAPLTKKTARRRTRRKLWRGR